MILTLAMPIHVWVLAALSIFLGAKLMQSGGILYERGKGWHGVTFLSAVCVLGPLFGIAAALIVQNITHN